MEVKRVSAKVGKPFEVELERGGAGGYLWKVNQTSGAVDAVEVEPQGTDASGSGSPAVGSSGQRFLLTANETGRSAVQFVLGRPWESGVVDVASYEIDATF